jgi:opacity protein-like surface antigen
MTTPIPIVHVRRIGLAALAVALLGAPRADAEVFVDVGVNSTRVEADIANQASKTETTSSGLHVGAGVRRALRAGSIGARLEIDDVDSDVLLAVRALDYRRHLSSRFALTAFLGAARLDLATPAFGYYLGGGVEIKELLRGWDLAIDLRLGDKIARDNLLPTDPQGGRPDNFYDLTGVSVYLRYRFGAP